MDTSRFHFSNGPFNATNSGIRLHFCAYHLNHARLICTSQGKKTVPSTQEVIGSDSLLIPNCARSISPQNLPPFVLKTSGAFVLPESWWPSDTQATARAANAHAKTRNHFHCLAFNAMRCDLSHTGAHARTGARCQRDTWRQPKRWQAFGKYSQVSFYPDPQGHNTASANLPPQPPEWDQSGSAEERKQEAAGGAQRKRADPHSRRQPEINSVQVEWDARTWSLLLLSAVIHSVDSD